MLSVKSITSCNINTTPLYSNNVAKTITEYKNNMKNIYNKDYTIEEDELIINCVQGMYGYRCGLLGYLSNLLSYTLSKKSNPVFLQSIINRFVNNPLNSNDYEIISFFTSLISRKIPIFNIGFWDVKNNLFSDNELFKYNIKNSSCPSIFNLKSTYLLNPLFDSGCAIYSNKKHIDSGYEPWYVNYEGTFKQRLFNKGLVWAFYESKNKSNGIAVINVEMINDPPEYVYLLQMKQIVRLKENLQNKFLQNKDYKKYETFIVGDFKSEFNLNILPNIKKRLKIFENANLVMYNKLSNICSTNFIFYNNYFMVNKINIKYVNNITNDNFSCINLELINEYKENESSICKLQKFFRKQKLRNCINDLKKDFKPIELKEIVIPKNKILKYNEPAQELKNEIPTDIISKKDNHEDELKEIVISNSIFQDDYFSVKEKIYNDNLCEIPLNNESINGLSISPISINKSISPISNGEEEWQTI
jgi:hypothetical protein